MMTKNFINFGTSMNVKNVNVQETFTCQNDNRDEITISTPHSTLFCVNKYPVHSMDIDIIDIDYDIDMFSVEQKCYNNIRVCGKFTYKFRALDADFRDILDTETIHTGYIYYFEDCYEDIKNGDYYYLNFCAELNIVKKNDVYTRTVNIHCETELGNIDFD